MMKFEKAIYLFCTLMLLASCNNAEKAQVKELVERINTLGASVKGQDHHDVRSRDSLFFTTKTISNCTADGSLNVSNDNGEYIISMYEKGECRFRTETYDKGSSHPHKTENELRDDKPRTCKFNLADIDFTISPNDLHSFECRYGQSCVNTHYGAGSGCGWGYSSYNDNKIYQLREMLVKLQKLADD